MNKSECEVLFMQAYCSLLLRGPITTTVWTQEVEMSVKGKDIQVHYKVQGKTETIRFSDVGMSVRACCEAIIWDAKLNTKWDIGEDDYPARVVNDTSGKLKTDVVEWRDGSVSISKINEVPFHAVIRHAATLGVIVATPYHAIKVALGQA